MAVANEKVILLVEDNPADVELTIRALKANNIANHVITVDDGAEALALLFGREPPASHQTRLTPAVILLDLKLPKVDGLEVLQRIRSDPQTALIPVVILTSSKQEEDRLAGYRLGANSYVRKPVEFEKFVEAVRHLGLYWLILNEPPPEIDPEIDSPT